MPDPVLGWNRDEIVLKVLDTLGRTTDTVLRARLEEDINFAQLGFWKLFDWKFSRTNGASQSSTNYTPLIDGVAGYSTSNTGVFGATVVIRTQDIEKVYISYNPTDPSDTSYEKYARQLIKVENREQIIADPGFVQSGIPEFYFPVGNTKIEIWPYPNTGLSTPADLIGQYLWIAGKRMPNFMATASGYPDIPIEYQETFIQYILTRALSRERDPSQVTEMQILETMINKDKEADLAEIESNLRMKWPEEELSDGNTRPRYQDVLWNDD